MGGPRTLNSCHGRLTWPERGVYFFFEPGELREHGGTLRVVRVGTHALTATSRTTLWKRLAQHRGNRNPPGGNHRGSIFRLLVGEALLAKGNLVEACQHAGTTWGRGNTPPPGAKEIERPLELEVSRVIGEMPFLWLDLPDAPGNRSLRGIVERGSIALLSNWHGPVVDPASPGCLGHCSPRATVRQASLWNQNHVAEAYDAGFLDTMEQAVSAVRNVQRGGATAESL